MASRKKHVIRYRRKREGKTDYKKRLKLLLSRKPRLVIRRSTTKILAQIVKYAPDGDHVLISLSSTTLKKKHGWTYSLKNIPAAYLLGLMLGKEACAQNHDSAVLDLGRQHALKGSVLFAVVKGAIDAGMQIPVQESVFPTQERLNGKHIVSSAKDDQAAALPKKVEALKARVLQK